MFKKTLYSLILLLSISGCASQGTFEPIVLSSNIPRHIALLVPLTGPLGHSGQAIRNGFFSAYYQQSQHTQGPTAIIRVYDTATPQDIRSLYEQAIQNGANLVVGPLAKNNVKRLHSVQNKTVLTLALNSIKSLWNLNEQMVQFGLSPTTEAKTVAQRMLSDQYQSALVIAAADGWGNGVAQAFNQTFKRGGGKIIEQLNYQPQQDLSAALKTVLQVKIKQPEQKKIVSETLATDAEAAPEESEPLRRQDIDAIFLAASAEKARQILPLLRFYYAGDLPVYATSLVYTGVRNQRANQDLNGVIFSDMPAIITSHRDLGKIPRLYALGKDAYTVSMQLSTGQFSSLQGYTGTLKLHKQEIQRSPSFARF